MYSRGFGESVSDVRIPEKYDGTALRDIQSDDSTPVTGKSIFEETAKREIKISPTEIPCINDNDEEKIDENESKPAGIFLFAPMKFISNFLPVNWHLGELIPKIELEELIIIGLAIFLFFSDCGDKECALLLLALIFIN